MRVVSNVAASFHTRYPMSNISASDQTANKRENNINRRRAREAGFCDFMFPQILWSVVCKPNRMELVLVFSLIHDLLADGVSTANAASAAEQFFLVFSWFLLPDDQSMRDLSLFGFFRPEKRHKLISIQFLSN